MSFTDDEITYLRSQRLARIATVAADGQPDVMPVGYQFDGKYFYVGGMNPVKTRKFRNVRAGNTKVALVIDDLVSVNPWTVRGLRIYGNAELIARQDGQFGPGEYMRFHQPIRGAGTSRALRPHTTRRSSTGAPSTKRRLTRARSKGN